MGETHIVSLTRLRSGWLKRLSNRNPVCRKDQSLSAFHHVLNGLVGLGLELQKFLMGFGGLFLKGLHGF